MTQPILVETTEWFCPRCGYRLEHKHPAGRYPPWCGRGHRITEMERVQQG